MLKRVGCCPLLPLSVFLYYHTLGITLPTATIATAAAATWNGIAFGGPYYKSVSLALAASLTGKKGTKKEGAS